MRRAVSLLLALAPAAHGGCAATPAPITQTAAHPAAPDRCSHDPVALAWGRLLSADTSQGNSRLEGKCVRAEAPECLYALDVPVRSELRVSLLSADFDGALALIEGVRSSGQELACVDDTPLGDTQRAHLERTVEPGKYLLVVDGARGETGRFELFAELEPLPPIAEICSAAQPLPEGRYLHAQSQGGASNFSASCGASAHGPDEVYRFTLDRPARVRLRQQGDFQAVLSFRADCADVHTELACSDQAFDGVTSLTAELGAGTYFAVADSAARGQGGAHVLALERSDVPGAVSAHELCQRAAPLRLDGTRHELDTLTESSALRGSCGGAGAPESVYRFSLDARSLVTLELTALEFDAVVYLRRDCEDEGAELLCSALGNLDEPFAPQSEPPRILPVELPRGAYTLVVDGRRATDMGAATLTVSAAPAKP